MSARYQQSGLMSFFFVSLFALSIMVIDAKTTWFEWPRTALSLILTPVQSTASFPAHFMRVVSDFFSSRPNLKIEYENLQAEYFTLKSRTLLLRALQEENNQLRALLGAQKRLHQSLSLAELLEIKIDITDHRVLIDKGLKDNVFMGQVVLNDKGVIGQVVEVLPLNSSVKLITDPSHVIPVHIARTGLRTTLHGTGDTQQMSIPYLNQNSDVVVGDVLHSSGLGGRFPQGYPVAKITDVTKLAGSAFLHVKAVPISTLQHSKQVLLLSQVKETSTQSFDVVNPK